MAFVFLVASSINTPKNICEFIDKQDATYTIYSSKASSMVSDSPKYGEGYIVDVSIKNSTALFSELKDNMYGQSVHFAGTFDDIESIIDKSNGQVALEDSFDGFCNIYLLGDFGESVVINGKKVNMQIVYKDGFVTVGCPIILGCY